MTQGHDARLAPLVDELMRSAGLAFSSLQRIAVIVGPGSFTGVRISVAFARGLSLALEIPAVGVTSLEALDTLPMDKRVLGLLPAKRRRNTACWLRERRLPRGGSGRKRSTLISFSRQARPEHWPLD